MIEPGRYNRFIELKSLGSGKNPISVILAGVHGNERAGITAFERLLPNLTLDQGTVIFGYGNPWAIAKNRRFIEADLNRLFKPFDDLSEQKKQSYEYRKRVPVLKKVFDLAEVLLDLHGTRNPRSKPFIIAEPNALEIVQYLPMDIVVSGIDEVTPGDYYMNSVGKIGICVESGYNEDPRSPKRAEESVWRFLQARGHIDKVITKNRQRRIQVFDMYRAKSRFVLAKPFEEFESVSKGQIIGTDGSTPVIASKQSVVIFCSQLKSEPGEGAFSLGEEK